MSMQLALDGAQEDFARSIRRACLASFSGEGEDHTRSFDRTLWRQLGETGLWGVLISGGDPTDLAVGTAALGSEAVAGPVMQTFRALEAGGLVDPDAVMSGDLVVTIGDSTPLTPFGIDADVHLMLDEGATTLSQAGYTDEPQPVRTLALEIWASGSLRSTGPATPARRAIAIGNLALAAYVVGAAERALDETVAYTRARQQFGQPIFTFQTVAHRLANASAELEAATSLVLGAARWLGIGSGVPSDVATSTAAAARLLAIEVGVQIGLLSHQLAGGMGYVDGTLIATLSRRMQLAAHIPPSRGWLDQEVVAFPSLIDEPIPS
jgi:alkylation response protein AidB-like acyl-CoA dehydrogenase